MIGTDLRTLTAAVTLAISLATSTHAENTVTMTLEGSSRAPAGTPADVNSIESCYFKNNPEAIVRAAFSEVYPGIDMVCIGDNFSTEYIFSLRPGADPNLITCFFKDSVLVSLLHAGSLQYRKDNVQIQISKPVAFLQDNGSEPSVRYLEYRSTADGYVTVEAEELIKETSSKLNGTVMNIVPGGQQPNGPMYDFFYSKFEARNDEILFFLNDAEANSMNARGANMYFDKNGNAWINQEMVIGRDELFSISNSKLTYDPEQTAGRRFAHIKDAENKTPFAKHPATGLSWYGALKYCNWLTLYSGRGIQELCYSEGTNTAAWAPVTATNWLGGVFSAAEREEWLKLKGFRLPMTGTNSPLLEANAFNEFYKAAAWNSFTNTAFSFGSDEYNGTSANFNNSKFTSASGTLPAGFFRQDNLTIFKDITPSANYYGFLDMSGNASEWSSDSNGRDIPVCGGSWADPPQPLNVCYFVPPHFTTRSVGLRLNTTYMPDYRIRIHILITFFLLEEELPSADLPETILQPFIEPGQEQPPASLGTTIPGSHTPTDYVTPGGIVYQPGEEPPPVTPPDGPDGPDGPGGGPTTPPVIIITTGTGPTTITTVTTTITTTSTSTPTTTIPTTSTTTIPPPIIRTLNVNSSNPGSGVWINATPDLSTNGAAFAPYSRQYIDGTSVTLTAPLNASGNTFQRWLLDGSAISTNLTVNFTMSTNYSIIAVYMYVPGIIIDPPPSPSGI